MPEIIVKLGDNVVQRFHYGEDKEVVSIGRARDNDIVVENLSVSRNHARIRRQDGKYILTDLNSANGSFVNGVKISKTELADNDIVSIGKHKLQFLAKAGSSASAGASAPAAASGSTGQSATAAPKLTDDAAIPTGAAVNGVLVVTRGKQTNQIFRLGKAEISIGRANENDIRLHDWFVSKKHAIIAKDTSGFLLKDLGSWRGTTVNGSAIKEHRLKEGDELGFGTTALTFRIGDAEDLMHQPTMQPPETQDAIVIPPPMATPPLITRGAVPAAEQKFQIEEEEPVSGMSGGDLESGPIRGDFTSTDEAELDSASHSRSTRDDVPVGGGEDDEFAPMTDDELEALENEAGVEMEIDEEELRRAEMEQVEAEKMMSDGGGWNSNEDEARREEERMARPLDGSQLMEEEVVEDYESEQAGEEASLFGGGAEEKEPESGPVQISERSVAAILESSPVQVSSGPKIAAPAEIAVPEGVDPDAVRRWSRGLHNRNKNIRREAARKLKELTGNDYDWESEPK